LRNEATDAGGHVGSESRPQAEQGQEGRGWNGELQMSPLHPSHEEKLAQGKLLVSRFIYTLYTEQCHVSECQEPALPARKLTFVHRIH